jgi:CMP-N,N'-diacetyllegionaminic acid synthase
MKNKLIAFIPARANSKRIKDKNILELNGHPLMAYSIISAIESKIFDDIICVTDSEKYADIARYYGAEVPYIRPDSISGDTSPDIEWVQWIANKLKEDGREYSAFSILRPTSPFRKSQNIKEAWGFFLENEKADSIRGVELCKQHPGKMWIIQNNNLFPILPYSIDNTPMHSNQYSKLPKIYIQNASLEIAWMNVVLEKNSISGDIIMPYLSDGISGFDINLPEDINLAKEMILKDKKILPLIKITPYSKF